MRDSSRRNFGAPFARPLRALPHLSPTPSPGCRVPIPRAAQDGRARRRGRRAHARRHALADVRAVRSALARAQGERLVYRRSRRGARHPWRLVRSPALTSRELIRRARVENSTVLGDGNDLLAIELVVARLGGPLLSSSRNSDREQVPDGEWSPPGDSAGRRRRRAAPPPPASTTSASTARSAPPCRSSSDQRVVGALVVTGRADGLIAEARSAVLDLADLLRHRARHGGRAGLLQRRALHARRRAALAAGRARLARRAASRARLRVRRRARRARRLLPRDDVGPPRARSPSSTRPPPTSPARPSSSRPARSR